MNYALIIAGGLCLFAGGLLEHLKVPLTTKRRMYWYLAALSGILWFLAGYPNLENMLGFLAMAWVIQLGWAYAHTPYIRINGKIYAFESKYVNIESENGPDELRRRNEFTTPTKMWWVVAFWPIVICAAICSSFLPGREGFSIHNDGAWILGLLGYCLFFGIVVGRGEAKLDRSIAQGQWPQFIIASICSAGLFAVFYLTAYHATMLVRERRED